MKHFENLIKKADGILNLASSGKILDPNTGALCVALNELSMAVSAAKERAMIPAYVVVDLGTAKNLVKRMKAKKGKSRSSSSDIAVLYVNVDPSLKVRSSEGECQINGCSLIAAIEKI